MNTVKSRGHLKYLILFLYSSGLLASSISIEVGQTEAVFNSFAIPNTKEDKISLPVDDTLTSYRLSALFDLESGNQIYFLIAPLSASYKFSSTKNFEFDTEIFAAAQDTEVNYKFNSYRLGYLWKWNYKTLNFWAGLVGKIRDAQIEVSQASKLRSYDNIGFVPLASFGFESYFTENLSVFSHTDALAASQGSAFDSQVEIRLNFEKVSFSLGKRVLGGGADNDNVYSFAQFDTYYTGIKYKF